MLVDRRRRPREDRPGPGPITTSATCPTRTGSSASTLYDPPYRFAGTPTDTDEGGHDDLYGTQVYRTKAEQMQLILDGATECARVTDQFLIIKGQDQVVAGSTRWQTQAIVEHLAAEWLFKDRLHLISYRPQPAGRSAVQRTQQLLDVPGDGTSLRNGR